MSRDDGLSGGRLTLAVLSESPADEAALRIYVAGIVAQPLHWVQPSLRARGWPNVLQLLPPIVRHLHFNTAAELLVVVVDSDDSVIHGGEHEAPDYFHPRCRVCQLRAAFRKATRNLPAARGRERVLRAVGLAVPAMEAWYLCGRDPDVSEQVWAAGLARGKLPYTRAELKQRMYGTHRPSLAHETARAEQAARRQQRDLRRLEFDFPGFALLAEDLRALRRQPESKTS